MSILGIGFVTFVDAGCWSEGRSGQEVSASTKWTRVSFSVKDKRQDGREVLGAMAPTLETLQLLKWCAATPHFHCLCSDMDHTSARWESSSRRVGGTRTDSAFPISSFQCLRCVSRRLRHPPNVRVLLTPETICVQGEVVLLVYHAGQEIHSIRDFPSVFFLN